MRGRRDEREVERGRGRGGEGGVGGGEVMEVEREGRRRGGEKKKTN